MQETRSAPGMEVRTDSHKVRVEVGPDRVVKHFKPAIGARRRFQCEIRALQCLSGIEGFPALLEFSLAHSTMAVQRVEGRPLLECEAPPDSVFTSLRVLVERMLERGVARHSLPPRDIIVRPDGHATLVDFERVTFRWCPWGPWWLSAAAIARFHLIRLLADGAPAAEDAVLGPQRLSPDHRVAQTPAGPRGQAAVVNSRASQSRMMG